MNHLGSKRCSASSCEVRRGVGKGVGFGRNSEAADEGSSLTKWECCEKLPEGRISAGNLRLGPHAAMQYSIRMEQRESKLAEWLQSKRRKLMPDGHCFRPYRMIEETASNQLEVCLFIFYSVVFLSLQAVPNFPLSTSLRWWLPLSLKEEPQKRALRAGLGKAE